MRHVEEVQDQNITLNNIEFV